MQYSDEQLLERLETLQSFNGCSAGVLDIWVRSKKDVFDRFDDKVYTFDCTDTSKPKFVMVCTGTSNAGAVGLKHFAKYNDAGCAVLKSDEIVYNSHRFGLHKGKYPAYVQNLGFPYFRDSNLDEHANETGGIHADIIGANCHHAGAHSEFIGGWSVACLVRNDINEWQKWLGFMNKREFLSVAILKEF